MSEPKVQLVDPQGNMNLPGMNATGVVTASSFSGDGGVVTGLTGGGNLNVGVVTATSFVGDGTGHAANLTGTPNLNLGLTTATSFVGDATGKAAGLTGTPNLNVGLVTATSFAGDVTGDVTGNITGLAVSVTSGVNLNVGVATGIQWHGDGSNLTGAGSSAYIAQEITATGGETIIDFSNGNLIYYKGNADTTVGFASTSAAEQITIIRDADPDYSISYSTGGVDFDGDDYLSMSDSNDFDLGSDDFTFEAWIKSGNKADSTIINQGDGNLGSSVTNTAWDFQFNSGGLLQFWWSTNGTSYASYAQSTASTGGYVWDDVWHHVAAVRNGSELYLFVDGVKQLIANDEGSNQEYANISGSIYSSTRSVEIGIADSQYPMDGIISNLRLIKGTALYTSSFVPPAAALTNVTNTKLLCCQSDSSTTTAAVTPGTISATGDPTAGAQTISLSGSLSASITWPSTVKWNGGTAPTLVSNDYSQAFQIFHFTTGDTGASYQAWEEMQNDRLGGDYSLFSWGINQIGELGQNENGPWDGTPAWANSRSSPTQVGTDTTWSRLEGTSGDGNTSLALKSDGTLWMWGQNSQGQGAQNDVAQRSSPTQVGTDTTWTVGNATRVAVLGSKSDGTLWSWGSATYGTLGQNSSNVALSSPTQIGTDTTWGTKKYQLGGNWTVGAAIKTDGTLWTWGAQGSYGELGHNNRTSYSSPRQVGTDTSWRSVGGGYGTTLATKTDGTLWSWGRNNDGGLAQNDTVQRSSPVQIPGTTWSEVTSYGGWQTMGVMKTDGTLWSWGNNSYGPIGRNDTLDRSSPTQVPGTNWKMCDRGDNGSVGAVKTDGTMWTWGYAGYGVLGQNVNAPLSSPMQIPGTTWHEVSVNTTTMLALKS